MYIHFHVQKAASGNVCICMIYINEQELETSPVNKDQRVRTVKRIPWVQGQKSYLALHFSSERQRRAAATTIAVIRTANMHARMGKRVSKPDKIQTLLNTPLLIQVTHL